MTEANPTDRLVSAVAAFLPDRTGEIAELLSAFRAWLEDVRSAASVQSASSVVFVAEKVVEMEARLTALEAGGDATN